MEVKTPKPGDAMNATFTGRTLPVNQWTYRKKILAPPCLGEALRREILVNILIFMVPE
jgi:hypothetical protein